MPYVEYDEVGAICSDCGRAFRSDEALAAHRIDSHSSHDEIPTRASAGPIRCEICDEPVPTAAARRAHQTFAHPTR